MVEGPRHVPVNKYCKCTTSKSLIGNIPYYALGPIVTEIASGYDHIASAIGVSISTLEGMNLLCYWTPLNTWDFQMKYYEGSVGLSSVYYAGSMGFNTLVYVVRCCIQALCHCATSTSWKSQNISIQSLKAYQQEQLTNYLRTQ